LEQNKADLMMLGHNIGGILAILALGVAFSERRRSINVTTIARTLALQAAIAAFVLLTPVGAQILGTMAHGVEQLIAYTAQGSAFVFGSLADQKREVIIAFQIMPVIIFIAALIAILYHWHVMPSLIRVLGGGISYVTGVSRLESLCAAATMFVGNIEGPLMIRPFLRSLSRAQLFAVMSGGLASVSGSVLVGYASLGFNLDYLICAAFMSAPGGLLFAKIIVPDVGPAYEPDHSTDLITFDGEHRPANVIEAAAQGAVTGLSIALNVAALLIAFVALVAMTNGILGALGQSAGVAGLSLDGIFKYVFAPIAWAIGIPWDESFGAAQFLGQKFVLNEFIAYISFAQVKATFSEHTQAVVTIALCGFANLTGMAIQLGALTTMVPERRSEIARLGWKAMIGGTLSNLMSAALVSMILNLK
jgi:CNT family concentrative nucleoside transporter